MSPALGAQILGFLQTEQRPVYKAAIQGLANQRNLRSVFIERKPPIERFAWVQAALGQRKSESLASHLLHAWLFGAHKQMLCDFLDGLGIQHAADGTVDELPTAPPREKIAATASQLLAKYPAETVAVYLHTFRDIDSGVQWQTLDEVLSEEPRLKL